MNRYLVIFILTFIIQSAWSNDEDIQKLLNYSTRATNFTRSYPPHEKVYLHMDNRSYFLDETLWYKAYVVDADSNRLTKASEILHIELLSPEGAVIRTQKQRLVDGQCDGYFTLDSALYSGYFEIRAYTKAMLNYDEQNYFSRVFPLFEKPKKLGEFDSIRRTLPRYRTVGLLKSKKELKKDSKKATKLPNYSIRFYPEGGNLVKDVKSQVAFQIKDSYGEIVNIECYLWQDEEVIDTISSSHLGMGIFQVTPKSDSKEYYITIKNDLKKSQFTLPDALDLGHVLNVDNITDSLNLKLRIKSTKFNDTLGVAILSRGCTGYRALIAPTKESDITILEVKKSELREGVNQIVIYDTLGRELLSRMVFIRNNNQDNQLKIDAITKKKNGTLNPFDHQEILFEVKDNKGKGVETTLSVSIYDSTSHTTTFCNDNIYTNLLLSSEVKGFIPNVDYYFESNDHKKEVHLDMLLQVYGWSRYKWEYLSGYKKMENKYSLEKHLSIYGRVFSQISQLFSFPDGKSYYYGDAHTRATYDSIPKLILDTKTIYLRNVWNDSLISEEDVITNYIELEDKFPLYKYQTDKQGKFSVTFDDFYGETTVILSLLRCISSDFQLLFHDSNPFTNGFFGEFIVTESEGSPQERAYDYFENSLPNANSLPYAIINGEYISQYLIDEIGVFGNTDLCFQPSIKTKHYMYSSRSLLTPRVIDWTYNRVNNSPSSSIEAYEIKHNYIKFSAIHRAHRKMSYDFLSVEDIHADDMVRISSIDFPYEYLKYYKLPLGTITTISNMTIDTSNVDGTRHSIMVPQKKSIEIFQNIDYLIGSKYICYIDSSIIHTNYKTRAKMHNKFNSHIDYQQYNIENNNKLPRPIYTDEVPNYVIENFYRIEKTPSELHNKTFSFFYSERIYSHIDLPVQKLNRSSGWGNTRDRVIMFQGLTRMEKEFYSPDYSKTPLPTQGDYRRTLYWNPNVKTDSNGQASVEFYNNSSCTKYNIDAQTVTKNGEIGVLFK